MLYRVFDRSALIRADVHTKLAQRLDIAIDGLPLGRDALLFELFENLRHRETLLGVCFLLEHPHKVQQLELLTVDSHESPPRDRVALHSSDAEYRPSVQYPPIAISSGFMIYCWNS